MKMIKRTIWLCILSLGIQAGLITTSKDWGDWKIICYMFDRLVDIPKYDLDSRNLVMPSCRFDDKEWTKLGTYFRMRVEYL